MDFELKLTEAQINLIINALGRMPYSEVAHLFAIIGQQINGQSAAQHRPEKGAA